ncbi:MAG: hypothetical protein K2L24_00535, partial [Opitutales bacterium]|nr:hypothetical protein [Opitutales bacterium]
MRSIDRLGKLGGYIGALLLLGGCESVGPKVIQEVKPSYNESIVKTDNEQLLLNLVRLKYRETTCFLEVSNIVENRKFTTRIGPQGSKISRHGNFDVSLGVAYMENFQNPSITFSPLKGEKFTKAIATPIPIPLVLGLIQTGWSPKRVFNICVERLNRLDNASEASGPTPKRPPEYKSFEQCVKLLNHLYKEDQLIFGIGRKDLEETLGPVPGNAFLRQCSQIWDYFVQGVRKMVSQEITGLPSLSPQQDTPLAQYVKELKRLYKGVKLVLGPDKDLIMRFNSNDPNQSDILELKKSLELKPEKSEFKLTSNFSHLGSGKDLLVRTRSLMEILFFLSHAVQVPEEDVLNGLVSQTIAKDGSIFDWERQLSGKWLHVLCSTERQAPKNSAVCVR